MLGCNEWEFSCYCAPAVLFVFLAFMILVYLLLREGLRVFTRTFREFYPGRRRIVAAHLCLPPTSEAVLPPPPPPQYE